MAGVAVSHPQPQPPGSQRTKESSELAQSTDMTSKVPKAVYVKSENLVTRRISGETVIVPVKGSVGELNSVYTLNELGTRVWQLLDGLAQPEIVDAIVEEYDVPAEQASREVSDFLANLESAKLIRAV
jgi:coenzyme PQQ synthesis protein D (PqqD)